MKTSLFIMLSIFTLVLSSAACAHAPVGMSDRDQPAYGSTWAAQQKCNSAHARSADDADTYHHD